MNTNFKVILHSYFFVQNVLIKHPYKSKMNKYFGFIMKQSKYEDMLKAFVSCSTFFPHYIMGSRKGNKTNELNIENMIHIYCVNEKTNN